MKMYVAMVATNDREVNQAIGCSGDFEKVIKAILDYAKQLEAEGECTFRNASEDKLRDHVWREYLSDGYEYEYEAGDDPSWSLWWFETEML